MSVVRPIRSAFYSIVCAMVVITGSPAFADDFPNDLAARDDAIRLEPMAPWNIDFGANKCRLARWFGAEDDVHLVVFEQGAPRESFGLSIAGPEIRRFANGRQFYLGMERDEEFEKKDRFGRGEIEGVGSSIIIPSERIYPDPPAGSAGMAGINLAEAGTIDRIVLRRGGRIISIETGNLAAPIEALNNCTSSLLAEWGLDPDQHQSYVRPVWLNEDAVVRRITDKYPRAALSRGEQGIFRLRVIVETDGSVSDCHLEKSTRTESLESPACDEMMRSQFEPARDIAGIPIRSFYAATISYAING